MSENWYCKMLELGFPLIIVFMLKIQWERSGSYFLRSLRRMNVLWIGLNSARNLGERREDSSLEVILVGSWGGCDGPLNLARISVNSSWTCTLPVNANQLTYSLTFLTIELSFLAFSFCFFPLSVFLFFTIFVLLFLFMWRIIFRSKGTFFWVEESCENGWHNDRDC